MQNQLGKVSITNQEAQEFVVNFPNGMTASYAASVLLILREPDVVFYLSEQLRADKCVADRITLYNTAISRHIGFSWALRSSFKVLQQNLKIIGHAAMTLAEFLSPKPIQTDYKMDDLKGTLVLVHPKLDDDPAENQNKMGRIVDADIDADDFWVEFIEGERPALYAANALLVLKPPDKIFFSLGKNADRLLPSDAMDIHKVALLLKYGVSNYSKAAMKLVQKNEKIGDFTVETLQDRLGLNQQHKIGR